MSATWHRFAGRYGTRHPRHATVLHQSGIEATVHWSATRRRQQVLLLGGAASLSLCTELRWRVLSRPVRHLLERGAVSCHTSQATVPALDDFLGALTPSLPWPAEEPWVASLQLDGTSAVHAACDLLRQRRPGRVAVASASYHGAVTSGYGARGRMPDQIQWPLVGCDHTEAQFYAWLDAHAARTSVLLLEPQGGSSVLGRPWEPARLRRVVQAAQARGVAVCCDEVMCGVGRHGRGGVFLSAAWDVRPDAVVFGKGISDGTLPLAGAAVRVRPGAGATGPVAESHTYSGASAPALACAAATLRLLPSLAPHVRQVEMRLTAAMRGIRAEGLPTSGQGLLWGIECADVDAMVRVCQLQGVLVYAVARGVMVTPPLDVPLGQLDDGLARLGRAVRAYAAMHPP